MEEIHQVVESLYIFPVPLVTIIVGYSSSWILICLEGIQFLVYQGKKWTGIAPPFSVNGKYRILGDNLLSKKKVYPLRYNLATKTLEVYKIFDIPKKFKREFLKASCLTQTQNFISSFSHIK
jgi:hypothetical protein